MKKSNNSYRARKYREKSKWVTLIGVVLFVGVILLLAVVMAWGFIYIKQSRTNGVIVKKVLAVEKNSEVAPYPPIKIKKNVTINLINGTGNAKYEREILKTLVESGYNLSNIESGKAKVFGDTGTTITSNADFEEIVAHIKNVLLSVTPEITDGTPNNDPNVSSGFDVVITTGSGVKNTNDTF